MAKTRPERQPQRHNFLEDLVVNGLCAARSVDPEEGLHFYISPPPPTAGICLLFSLDWGGKAPLIPNIEKKVDYLSLFVPAGGGPWLATLIEMKACQESHQREAIDQITNSRRLLRRALEELDVTQRIVWQAIILHHQGGNFPRQKALDARIPILSVQTPHKADLSTFVTQRLETGTAPAPKRGGANTHAPDRLRPIERTLMLGTRSSRPPASPAGLEVEAKLESEALTLSFRGGRWVVTGSPSIREDGERLCAPRAGG